MSEQAGRKTWHADGRFVMEDVSNLVIAISPLNLFSVVACAYAKQIADDHNRIPQLEAEVARLRDALGALVKATTFAIESMNYDGMYYVSTRARRDEQRDALANAKAALSTEGQAQAREGYDDDEQQESE